MTPLMDTPFFNALLAAILLQSGPNASLVAIGAALLGFAAGMTGSFLVLRKRALISDAISHATLPGLVLGFAVMVWLGMSGRNPLGLMLGAAVSAGLGLWIIHWLKTHTRLGEDAAMGAVLSVFFGAGVVGLGMIQLMPQARVAGLEDMLLGSTAAMLRADAWVLAAGGALVVALALTLRRGFVIVAFDQSYASAQGWSVGRFDAAAMGLALLVTLAGLRIVGVILIVALLIIPPVTARLWSARAHRIPAIAGALGAAAGYLGAAISASAADLPTGPVIILVAAAGFAISLLIAPEQGLLARLRHHAQMRRRVHLRQGLLGIAKGITRHDPVTAWHMRRAGLIGRDGLPSAAGQRAAAEQMQDEARLAYIARHPEWRVLLRDHDGVTALQHILTRDALARIDSDIRGAG